VVSPSATFPPNNTSLFQYVKIIIVIFPVILSVVARLMLYQWQRQTKTPQIQTHTEDTMTTNTNTTTGTQVEAGYETSKFALGTGMAMAALIGIWGAACLVNALVSVGPMNVVKGYLTALIG
jgi:hypothetical protein